MRVLEQSLQNEPLKKKRKRERGRKKRKKKETIKGEENKIRNKEKVEKLFSTRNWYT